MVPFNDSAQATKQVRRCRVPDYGPWPPVGYVTARKVMAALGGVSDETIRNYERAGLLPPRQPITGGTGGWRVDVIRDAIDALPSKLKARAEERRQDKVAALRKARSARRVAAPAQAGHANVAVLLLAALAAGAALLLGVEAGALAMAAPALGARAALEMPDPVDQALAGERAALRVLRRIRDGLGTGDELLGELRDVVFDDGGNVPATPRLRAFLRTIQKRLEGRS